MRADDHAPVKLRFTLHRGELWCSACQRRVGATVELRAVREDGALSINAVQFCKRCVRRMHAAFEKKEKANEH